jgi:N-acetylglucosamine kinase-like BadF-type ATPase
MARYLGVDGGGTKTAFALLDDQGRVLASAITRACYYFADGLDVVEDVLTQGVTDVCGQAGIGTGDIDAAFFGIPGYGEASADRERLDALGGRVLGHDRYYTDNDMVCGWAGSLAAEDGINVISGTGSMAYGQRDGTGSRTGGWGELFGDEGSGYWVATQGLNAFSRMSDGRLPRGPLYEILKARLQIATDLDAVSLVIDSWGGDRRSIAALATAVGDAARAGDTESDRILDAAADELAIMVETARLKLGFNEQDTVPVSYSGGMFADDSFLARFLTALHRLAAKYDPQPPLLDPALGAAVYAARRSGHPLNPDALHQLLTRSHP